MGFFGQYIFDGKTWRSADPGSAQVSKLAAPWLSVEIYDSDIATIRYEPAGPGSGTAYLGHTPRTYFEDHSASAPTDVYREAQGLASWLMQQQNRDDENQLRELIASFLAADVQEAQLDDDSEFDDEDDLDDDEVFVEFKTARFLRAIGLSAPDELPRR